MQRLKVAILSDRLKIPKWVREYPYELDRAALMQLARASKGRFDKPREMNYVLCDFADAESIEGAVSHLEQKGWKCTTMPQAEEPGKTTIEAQKMEYRITEDAYLSDTAFFLRISDLYHASYDGWYASGG